MKLELYVVLTKNPDKAQLNQIKVRLCEKYGGLTVMGNCHGLWLNHMGNLDSDKVEIWRVITDKIVLPSEAITIGEQLKAICAQESQMLTINDHAYFV